jgi:hypothetical protein
MTLTTHAIIGASVAQFFPNQPILGLVAAIGSHYVADVIPHISVGDYLGSIKRGDSGRLRPLEGFFYGWRFVGDALIVFADMLIGLVLSWLIWKNSTSLFLIMIGSIGGTLPDLLQIAYGLTKFKMLAMIKKVHDFMHAPDWTDIKNIPLGIFVEAGAMFLVVGLTKLF